jgi:hypothetical protein
MGQRLKSACTHTLVRTAKPLVIDPGLLFLLPPPHSGVSALPERWTSECLWMWTRDVDAQYGVVTLI